MPNHRNLRQKPPSERVAERKYNPLGDKKSNQNLEYTKYVHLLSIQITQINQRLQALQIDYQIDAEVIAQLFISNDSQNDDMAHIGQLHQVMTTALVNFANMIERVVASEQVKRAHKLDKRLDILQIKDKKDSERYLSELHDELQKVTPGELAELSQAHNLFKNIFLNNHFMHDANQKKRRLGQGVIGIAGSFAFLFLIVALSLLLASVVTTPLSLPLFIASATFFIASFIALSGFLLGAYTLARPKIALAEREKSPINFFKDGQRELTPQEVDKLLTPKSDSQGVDAKPHYTELRNTQGLMPDDCPEINKIVECLNIDPTPKERIKRQHVYQLFSKGYKVILAYSSPHSNQFSASTDQNYGRTSDYIVCA